MPLSGLEDELSWLYYKKGRLGKLIADADNLIKRSGSEEDAALTDPDVAIPRLSMGGVIALNRTLSKLRALLEAQKER
jgi:ubiquitin-conjugating enzyme E2 O